MLARRSPQKLEEILDTCDSGVKHMSKPRKSYEKKLRLLTYSDLLLHAYIHTRRCYEKNLRLFALGLPPVQREEVLAARLCNARGNRTI